MVFLLIHHLFLLYKHSIPYNLLQFFVLTGGRIEVALRIDTQQTFNPKSVRKISEDEISTVQN